MHIELFIQWEYPRPSPSQASRSSDISGRFSAGCAGTVPGAKPLVIPGGKAAERPSKPGKNVRNLQKLGPV